MSGLVKKTTKKRGGRGWSTLSSKDLASLNEQGKSLTEQPGVAYRRPRLRSECESVRLPCPWCDDVVVMVIDRPLGDPLGEDLGGVASASDVQIKCPLCDGAVRYEEVHYGGSSASEASLWRWVRALPGDMPDLRGMPHCRPCIHVGCSAHVFLDVKRTTHGPSMKLNFPGEGPEDFLGADGTIRPTCALDVSDEKGITLGQVGAVVNVTRERIRQIENHVKSLPIFNSLRPFNETGKR